MSLGRIFAVESLSFVFVLVFVLLFVLVVRSVEERRQERRGASVEAQTQGQAGHAERKLGRRGVPFDAAGGRGRRRALFPKKVFRGLFSSAQRLRESRADERATRARLARVPCGAGVVREQRRRRRVLRGDAREHGGVSQGQGEGTRRLGVVLRVRRLRLRLRRRLVVVVFVFVFWFRKRVGA